nr:integrase, catalytic region, zinc finger, CCHC-type, peptidase aspartic, catalytic [Tanacetum cinerariifolium]GFB26136.1 integrase, catalytic region, zinc finger, CCHC-type, peptidase aspartic, catalytic [Tanacetum cinerariifolium]
MVRFENDHFGAIMGYGYYVIGNSVISRVYYVKGLGHNLFFIGKFCDFDLEVAFRKHSCYVRDTYDVELIKEPEILFHLIFDEYLEPPHVEKSVSPTPAVQVPVNSVGVATESTLMDENPFAPIDNNLFINIFASEPTSEASSSRDASSAESTYVTQTLHHLRKWSKDHPIDNVVGNLS